MRGGRGGGGRGGARSGEGGREGAGRQGGPGRPACSLGCAHVLSPWEVWPEGRPSGWEEGSRRQPQHKPAVVNQLLTAKEYVRVRAVHESAGHVQLLVVRDSRRGHRVGASVRRAAVLISAPRCAPPRRPVPAGRRSPRTPR
ncbi:hypothetical protein E1298_25020 [Actinomadura rubrisoli]|uniref:Uncharacterized protein n=1 Tax=Actinomadura rubrisoli TaxID=2530368 RepID=A0A4R5B7K6_9ACTN|nr:hypothetical protein E1298_25020 [Actinomadura rubrisoli]